MEQSFLFYALKSREDDHMFPLSTKQKHTHQGILGASQKKKNTVPVDTIPTAARIMAGRCKEKPKEISIAALQGLAVVTHAKAIA